MTEQEFRTFAEQEFPGHKVGWGGSWYYISANMFLTSNYHFEYNNGCVEFHIEGSQSDWKEIRQWLRVEHPSDYSPKAKKGWRNDCVWSYDKPCNSDEEIKNEFLHLKETIFPLIDSFVENKELKPKHIDRPSSSSNIADYLDQMKEHGKMQEVTLLGDVSLGMLFEAPLSIPPYQRIYCWTKKNVDDLLRTIRDLNESITHLGSIILHRNSNNTFDIVDGQQRLVTLTLLLEQLGYLGCLPLINEKFESEEACNYIAYNKYLCNRFASNYRRPEVDESFINRMLGKVQFSVLVINSSEFELAYTFFSNANSKGKPLSDYSLLKAHHLRYIESIPQQMHMAKKWDTLTLAEFHGKPILEDTLGRHVLHLRRWLCGKPLINRKYVVRDEYVAAPTIEDIPPFGEKFDFYEKIQGGQHFFAFSQNMTERYEQFVEHPEHIALEKHLSGESHWRYAELIDALLFGYYLKFGQQYLAEALFSITTAVSRHRYSTGRALRDKIEQFVADSRIVMMLNQATSPTFFLADLVEPILNEGIELGKDGIRKRYADQTKEMYKELLRHNRFSDDYVKKIMKDCHGIEI